MMKGKIRRSNDLLANFSRSTAFLTSVISAAWICNSSDCSFSRYLFYKGILVNLPKFFELRVTEYHSESLLKDNNMTKEEDVVSFLDKPFYILF